MTPILLPTPYWEEQKTLLSEDMQSGMLMDGVTVVNPF
jgi:predicted nucleic acid-binding protein